MPTLKDIANKTPFPVHSLQAVLDPDIARLVQLIAVCYQALLETKTFADKSTINEKNKKAYLDQFKALHSDLQEFSRAYDALDAQQYHITEPQKQTNKRVEKLLQRLDGIRNTLNDSKLYPSELAAFLNPELKRLQTKVQVLGEAINGRRNHIRREISERAHTFCVDMARWPQPLAQLYTQLATLAKYHEAANHWFPVPGFIAALVGKTVQLKERPWWSLFCNENTFRFLTDPVAYQHLSISWPVSWFKTKILYGHYHQQALEQRAKHWAAGLKPIVERLDSLEGVDLSSQLSAACAGYCTALGALQGLLRAFTGEYVRWQDLPRDQLYYQQFIRPFMGLLVEENAEKKSFPLPTTNALSEQANLLTETARYFTRVSLVERSDDLGRRLKRARGVSWSFEDTGADAALKQRGAADPMLHALNCEDFNPAKFNPEAWRLDSPAPRDKQAVLIDEFELVKADLSRRMGGGASAPRSGSVSKKREPREADDRSIVGLMGSLDRTREQLTPKMTRKADAGGPRKTGNTAVPTQAASAAALTVSAAQLMAAQPRRPTQAANKTRSDKQQAQAAYRQLQTVRKKVYGVDQKNVWKQLPTQNLPRAAHGNGQYTMAKALVDNPESVLAHGLCRVQTPAVMACLPLEQQLLFYINEVDVTLRAWEAHLQLDSDELSQPAVITQLQRSIQQAFLQVKIAMGNHLHFLFQHKSSLHPVQRNKGADVFMQQVKNQYVDLIRESSMTARWQQLGSQVQALLDELDQDLCYAALGQRFSISPAENASNAAEEEALLEGEVGPLARLTH